MLRIDGIPLSARDFLYTDQQETGKLIIRRVSKLLGIPEADIKDLVILKRSLDARKKPDIFFIYSVALSVKGQDRFLNSKRYKNVSVYKEKAFDLKPVEVSGGVRPVVVGFGPAGMACAYTLSKLGYKPLIIERGRRVADRVRDVEAFWESGKLDPNSNVQFGEGGAGAFSDGKLNTGNKDRDGLQKKILTILAEHGAPEEIVYDSKPHLGTDLLRVIVENIRTHIEDMGGEFLFETTLQEILLNRDGTEVVGLSVNEFGVMRQIEAKSLFLAIGHSAGDTFESLIATGVSMIPKAFAMGYRVIHPQETINRAQYGDDYPREKLPAASYKLTHTTGSGRPVYSFCMCPGGFVVDSSGEEGRLCVNGMSYSGRDGQYANSAIIMGITPGETAGLLQEMGIRLADPEAPLLGMQLVQEVEKRAYKLAGGCIPVTCLGEGIRPETDPSPAFKGQTEYIEKLVSENLVLPKSLNEAFREGMAAFGRSIRLFDESTTVIAAVESRTSSPVRIVRGDDHEAVDIRGLYPCGEGAGYAGGIMSAAMDGARTVLSAVRKGIL